MHHFINAGLYDGLFVMQDTETETLWNHISGTAMHGELVGHRLPVSNLLQMNVRQALDMNADIQVAISDRPISGMFSRMGPDNGNAQLMGQFAVTLGSEDTRRDRMEMGLGIWTKDNRKYYPMDVLKQQGRVLLDDFDGRSVLVYVDPLSSTPTALYVDATAAKIEERDVTLDTGQAIKAGMLVGEDDQALPMERPQQIFTRWYGYALTFPGADIYGE